MTNPIPNITYADKVSADKILDGSAVFIKTWDNLHMSVLPSEGNNLLFYRDATQASSFRVQLKRNNNGLLCLLRITVNYIINKPTLYGLPLAFDKDNAERLVIDSSLPDVFFLSESLGPSTANPIEFDKITYADLFTKKYYLKNAITGHTYGGINDGNSIKTWYASDYKPVILEILPNSNPPIQQWEDAIKDPNFIKNYYLDKYINTPFASFINILKSNNIINDPQYETNNFCPANYAKEPAYCNTWLSANRKDGGLSEWGEWGTCTNGKKSRSRSCTNPSPAYGGQDCVGPLNESTTCPINGGVSAWGEWTNCINGLKTRNRTCTNPSPANGGKDCDGPLMEAANCPIDGGLSGWGEFGPCVNGNKTRKRLCNNPKPANGGKDCIGPLDEITSCPVDGGLGEWGAWGACTNGSKSRSRSCNNPSPLNGGKDCTGPLNETATCPIDGGLSDWSAWTNCANGIKTRKRSCNNPTPANGGQPCSGVLMEADDCAIDGGFSDWSEDWSSCINGMQTTSRLCNNPSPANGGQSCVGDYTKQRSCVMPTVANPAAVNPAANPAVNPAANPAAENPAVNPDVITPPLQKINGGLSLWSEWGECLSGKKTRNRLCNNPSPANGGEDCGAPLVETTTCAIQTPVETSIDGGFSDWSEDWSSCINGMQTTSRLCNNPSPANGGKTCTGDYTKQRSCLNPEVIPPNQSIPLLPTIPILPSVPDLPKPQNLPTPPTTSTVQTIKITESPFELLLSFLVLIAFVMFIWKLLALKRNPNVESSLGNGNGKAGGGLYYSQ